MHSQEQFDEDHLLQVSFTKPWPSNNFLIITVLWEPLQRLKMDLWDEENCDSAVSSKLERHKAQLLGVIDMSWWWEALTLFDISSAYWRFQNICRRV